MSRANRSSSCSATSPDKAHSFQSMPKIQEMAVRQLLPTQLTVGMIEVREKTKHLASLKPKPLQEYLADRAMPVVSGPGGRHYITDHHHLARAALDAGIDTAFFSFEADLSRYDVEEFWREMNRNLWVHPREETGISHHSSLIPTDLKNLID